MAYIEEFTVSGLAGQDKVLHRRLDRHVNIFWGLNGTGKTSLLKILHSALRNDVSVLEEVPFERAEVIFRSTDHEATLQRSIYKHDVEGGSEDQEVTDFEIDDDFERDSYVELSAPRLLSWDTTVIEGEVPGNRVAIPYRHVYLPISRMSRVETSRNRPRFRSPAFVDDAFLDAQFADQVQRRWVRYMGEANSRIRNIQQAGLASILAQLFGSGRMLKEAPAGIVPKEDAYQLVSTFLADQGIGLRMGREDFLRQYEDDPRLQTVVAHIGEVTAEVREALRPQEEFQAVLQNLYGGSKRVVLDKPNLWRGLTVTAHDEAIPLKSLSSGEKQLMRLLLEALAAEQGTVMIDEPELSMHVDWQEVLVDSMRKVNPECQLLLATHSPEVMANVRDEVVFQL